MALGGAGLSDHELQRLMLEHDAAQDNVILTESGLRHRHPRELGGDCGRYRWLQTDTEIVVEAPLPSGTLPSQIRVKVHTAYLAVHVKDDTIVSGKLSRVRTLPTCLAPHPLCPTVPFTNTRFVYSTAQRWNSSGRLGAERWSVCLSDAPVCMIVLRGARVSPWLSAFFCHATRIHRQTSGSALRGRRK